MTTVSSSTFDRKSDLGSPAAQAAADMLDYVLMWHRACRTWPALSRTGPTPAWGEAWQGQRRQPVLDKLLASPDEVAEPLRVVAPFPTDASQTDSAT